LPKIRLFYIFFNLQNRKEIILFSVSIFCIFWASSYNGCLVYLALIIQIRCAVENIYANIVSLSLDDILKFWYNGIIEMSIEPVLGDGFAIYETIF
jgi:hypothetical protein